MGLSRSEEKLRLLTPAWRGMVTFRHSSEQLEMGGLTTKPSEIFRQRVEPAYSDYLRDPLSGKYANTLAGALDAHLEWTYKHLNEVDPSRLNGATLGSFREGLLTEHQALHVMCDLAVIAKYRVADRDHKPPRVVTLSTDAYYEKEGVLYVNHFHTPFASEAGHAVEFWRKWPD
jgi:hypothetical protein